MTIAPVSSYAILIDHAAKSYRSRGGGSADAVVDVSLKVSSGAIHGLLGPNGAGKTTTLKMLLGLVKPSGGRFEIDGVDASKPIARKGLGFLPEQPYFPPQLTADEALVMYGRLAGLDTAEIRSAAPDLLATVGLHGRGATTLSKFSRGMLQRFGLAQALLGEPRIVVLDEPASGLDPVGQRDVRNLMLELRSAGVTVLLSSHQLSEVEAVCDEVTILNRGRVAARGHIDDLLNVAGQTSVKARGQGALPAEVESLVSDTAASGGIWVFSVADTHVRRVVDALDDGGFSIVSIEPKRESLEDYFAAMLDASPAAQEGGGQ